MVLTFSAGEGSVIEVVRAVCGLDEMDSEKGLEGSGVGGATRRWERCRYVVLYRP